jgi:hypothetical protein
MKIAYIDLNDETFWEDYSISPKKYGGGRVFAAAAKENYLDFHLDIYANPRSFDNVTDSENKRACIPTTWEQRDAIRQYKPIKDIIANAEQYDLFVTHNMGFPINTEGLKGKLCAWALGREEWCDPRFKHVLQYNEYQLTKVGPETKTYRTVIGKPLPEFREYNKENFIFQCTRHTPIFGSIEIAATCNNLGIKAYFAGPIDKDYPLLQFIDNKNTFYLGIISEEIKIEFLKRARLCTFYHRWNTPFNLSAIEALSYGTPIAATPVGFWPSLVKKENGFFFSSEEDFKKKFEENPFSQRDCWNSAQPYSEQNMIDSFLKAFQTIVNEGNLPQGQLDGSE